VASNLGGDPNPLQEYQLCTCTMVISSYL